MTISITEAKANLTYLYQRYLPSRPDRLDDALSVINDTANAGESIQASYDWLISYFSLDVGQYANAFPGHPVTIADRGNAAAYNDSIPSTTVVDYYYPNASTADKAALVQKLDAGLSVADFLEGWTVVSQVNPKPAASTVIDAAADSDYVPGPQLSFAGVTDKQLDFLTGVYVGSFNRAPEYGGLKYWAAELSTNLRNGMGEADAFRTIVATMFKAGAENGEQGSTMTNTSYVSYLYQNVLGRAPDKGGLDYWVNDLSKGVVQREVFLETFLKAALEHKADAGYISPRVEVAQFAAQQHVSGNGTSGIDLRTVLNGVKDASTAKIAINALVDKFGAAPTAATALIASWDSEASTDFSFNDVEIQQIEIVGIASVESQGFDMIA